MSLLFLLIAGAVAIIVVGGRRRQTVIERTINIRATPEEVFRHLETPESIPQYAPGVQSVSDVRMTDEHLGDTFNVNYSVLGLKFPTRFTVVSYNANSSLSARMEGGMAGTFDWDLRERAGSTDVTVEIKYEMQGGVAGRAADRLIIHSLNEKNATRMLDNLKTLVERH